jgi:hypothetical protein
MVVTGQMKLMLGGCDAASRGSSSDQADSAGPIKRTLSALFCRDSTKVDCVAVK